MANTKKDVINISIRFPVETRDQLKDAAEASGRSMNSEIVNRLQQSLKPVIVDAERKSSAKNIETMNERLRELEASMKMMASFIALKKEDQEEGLKELAKEIQSRNAKKTNEE